MPHNVSYSNNGFSTPNTGSQNSLNLSVPSPASSTISSNAGPQSPFGLPRNWFLYPLIIIIIILEKLFYY